MAPKRISKATKKKTPKSKFVLDRRTIFVIVGSLLVFLLMSYLGMRTPPSTTPTPGNGSNPADSRPATP